MGTVPIHEQSVRLWGTMYSIGPASTSIIVSSKIIEISNSDNPMRGFGTVEAAARFCCAFDELQNYFRQRLRMGESVSLPERRRVFLDRLVALQALLQAVS